MRGGLVLIFLAGLLWFFLSGNADGQDAPPLWQVCAIGDSHVVPGSYFLTRLQHELGDEYFVYGVGRRGWTAQRWINTGDFASSCTGADIVLVSLGGNDRAHGLSWSRIRTRVDTLIATLPSTVRVVYHMTVPRFYRPRVSLEEDGIHLSRTGARSYARIVAPFLRVQDP